MVAKGKLGFTASTSKKNLGAKIKTFSGLAVGAALAGVLV